MSHSPRLALLAGALALALPHTARGACSNPPLLTESWSATWTDSLGQTSYAITAPCKVNFGQVFQITLRVTDAAFPEDLVASKWSLVDTSPSGPSTLASGPSIRTSAGAWQVSIRQQYTDVAVNHDVRFTFADLGAGAGAHAWTGAANGGIVVDPYPNEPPSADAGPDLAVPSADAGDLAVAGAASDPEGDALTYRWLLGETELQAARPVETSGAAPLDAGALRGLARGAHALTLEVRDAEGVATDSATVTVENTPPVAVPFAGGTVQPGELVVLAGTVADFDGGAVAWRWLEGARVLAEGSLDVAAGGAAAALPAAPLLGLPPGTHALVLVASDGEAETVATTAVTVLDAEAPTLAPVASPRTLWPPDGRRVPVVIAAHAHDAGGGPVSLDVVVTGGGTAPDRRGPDVEIVSVDDAAGSIALLLRAELDRHARRRVYVVRITATDAAGNASTAEVPVVVSRRRAAAAGGDDERDRDGREREREDD